MWTGIVSRRWRGVPSWQMADCGRVHATTHRYGLLPHLRIRTLLTPLEPLELEFDPKGETWMQEAAAAEAATHVTTQQTAELIFSRAFAKVEAQFGRSEMVFPKDIMWLAGAPGAGKATLTPHIMDLRHLTLEPIEISSLLTSPTLTAKKEAGELVDDEDVLATLLAALIDRTKVDPFGVIVDGFPRTPVQAHCISLLFDTIRALRREFYDGLGDARFRRPIFHVTVLFLPKWESVQRQLDRGRAAVESNRKVKLTGVGTLQAVRPTDTDECLAGKRYDHFQSTLVESLEVVKHRFHFHFIDADAPIEQVKENVQDELEYQSSLELAEETFEAVRRFPLATELTAHARQELVNRLDLNYTDHRQLFDSVLDVMQAEFEPFMRSQALTGRAIIRTEHPVFSHSLAPAICLDVLAERGFHAHVDYMKKTTPAYIEATPFTLTAAQLAGDGEGDAAVKRAQWAVRHKTERVLVFDIQWRSPKIRRGTASKDSSDSS